MPDAKYDARHQRTREQWRPLVEAGGVCCGFCGRPIVAGKILQGSRLLSNWHLDHKTRGPAHWKCNTADGGRSRRQGRRRPRVFAPLNTSRNW